MAPKIIVLGSTGYIGSATVKTLAQQKANITAGVRDPSKAQELVNAGAKVIKADMGLKQTELASILANYDHLYVVTPGHIDRTNLTLNAIKAAKQANIKYILVVSIPPADNLNILFGRQFTPIEKELKSSGLTYGLLRLPMFVDNIWGNAEAIKTQNTFYGPIDGSKKFVTVAVQDAALAAAVILQNPTNHANKTYTLTSDFSSSDEQAQFYTQALGRTIKYVSGGYEATKQALLKFMPEWQVDGILELYKLVENQDASQTTFTNDFKKITGQEPTTHAKWMQQFSKAF
ncbi:Trk system potassium uptake protein TrkA, amine-terminal domain protein (macronuclear) [Tetrahymena thermophila SB210]|uniref:Trk system potassium uptake protein TrkA, amine-terminal domain protein n=1 Tax=Tetrahymena thermophila (strain SB210) TaxID=312017 RepID=Q23Q90_TETTS|nr:Trk system potassium uptake protein TrkA, amine-terminal domain protein [Tetrahymena thermophila SB210]EAR98694.1 Trk system potassium uptake protein TrkA, amine-terminal domain protein [Tetrahymena thermophila SB210]|eukprot:XP_001018939.1 Trk system potassium uptake protein TrkA, amine-terminal domain protein [Tetrahymena thermophila SB210]